MKVGILGAGGMGATHARHYSKMPDVQLMAFDVHGEKLQRFCETWKAEAASSQTTLIESCDAIGVCLPTDLHLPIGLEIIDAGKPLLMEKPMASNVEQCTQLFRAAETAGVLLMPGQVVRFFPEFKSARKLIIDGAIGKPAAVRTRRGGKAPSGEGGWFKDFARSGGILLDLAVHDFDWLRWTLGEVKSVYSAAAAHRRDLGGVDYALTTLTFESGAIAHVESTWMDPAGGRVTFEVCGSEGMLEFDSRVAHSLRVSLSGASITESPLMPEDDPYFNQLQAFVVSVMTKEPPPVTAYDGLMAVSIAEAAIESSKSGRSVRPVRPI